MSIFYADLLDVLRAAGCQVAESATTDGWQTRSRSSGGFPSPPLCTFWHHTASSTSPANDLAYMIDGSDDAPVGNMLIDRDGVCWPIAAGASNCAGKGGPATFSRGTIPADQGNTRGWQIEVANGGTGEAWPQVQVDAFFAASNALNVRFGNEPTDVITHQVWAPTRKIDPATAAAVQGPWRPNSCTSSGTWQLEDIRSECARRAANAVPKPEPEDDMKPAMLIAANDTDTNTAFWWTGTAIGWVIHGAERDAGVVMGYYQLDADGDYFRNFDHWGIQQMINTQWCGGAFVPSSYTAPPPGVSVSG